MHAVGLQPPVADVGHLSDAHPPHQGPRTCVGKIALAVEVAFYTASGNDSAVDILWTTLDELALAHRQSSQNAKMPTTVHEISHNSVEQVILSRFEQGEYHLPFFDWDRITLDVAFVRGRRVASDESDVVSTPDRDRFGALLAHARELGFFPIVFSVDPLPPLQNRAKLVNGSTACDDGTMLSHMASLEEDIRDDDGGGYDSEHTDSASSVKDDDSKDSTFSDSNDDLDAASQAESLDDGPVYSSRRFGTRRRAMASLLAKADDEDELQEQDEDSDEGQGEELAKKQSKADPAWEPGSDEEPESEDQHAQQMEVDGPPQVVPDMPTLAQLTSTSRQNELILEHSSNLDIAKMYEAFPVEWPYAGNWRPPQFRSFMPRRYGSRAIAVKLHQLVSAVWDLERLLAGGMVFNADDMGMGKTLQNILLVLTLSIICRMHQDIIEHPHLHGNQPDGTCNRQASIPGYYLRYCPCDRMAPTWLRATQSRPGINIVLCHYVMDDAWVKQCDMFLDEKYPAEWTIRPIVFFNEKFGRLELEKRWRYNTPESRPWINAFRWRARSDSSRLEKAKIAAKMASAICLCTSVGFTGVMLNGIQPLDGSGSAIDRLLANPVDISIIIYDEAHTVHGAGSGRHQTMHKLLACSPTKPYFLASSGTLLHNGVYQGLYSLMMHAFLIFRRTLEESGITGIHIASVFKKHYPTMVQLSRTSRPGNVDLSRSDHRDRLMQRIEQRRNVVGDAVKTWKIDGCVSIGNLLFDLAPSQLKKVDDCKKKVTDHRNSVEKLEASCVKMEDIHGKASQQAKKARLDLGEAQRKWAEDSEHSLRALTKFTQALSHVYRRRTLKTNFDGNPMAAFPQPERRAIDVPYGKTHLEMLKDILGKVSKTADELSRRMKTGTTHKTIARIEHRFMGQVRNARVVMLFPGMKDQFERKGGILNYDNWTSKEALDFTIGFNLGKPWPESLGPIEGLDNPRSELIHCLISVALCRWHLCQGGESAERYAGCVGTYAKRLKQKFKIDMYEQLKMSQDIGKNQDGGPAFSERPKFLIAPLRPVLAACMAYAAQEFFKRHGEWGGPEHLTPKVGLLQSKDPKPTQDSIKRRFEMPHDPGNPRDDHIDILISTMKMAAEGYTWLSVKMIFKPQPTSDAARNIQIEARAARMGQADVVFNFTLMCELFTFEVESERSVQDSLAVLNAIEDMKLGGDAE